MPIVPTYRELVDDAIALLMQFRERLISDEGEGAPPAVQSEQAAPSSSGTPSFEQVFNDSPDGLGREDFARALTAAGYDSGPRGFMEFGLANLEAMMPEVRKRKMDFLVELASTASSMAAPGQRGAVAQARSAGGVNLFICPSGEDHGEAWENETRDGTKKYFKCREKSCHRPGTAVTTTWDATNYERRQEEFRTGVLYRPTRQYSNYSRSGGGSR